jgi:hypothetical protein
MRSFAKAAMSAALIAIKNISRSNAAMDHPAASLGRKFIPDRTNAALADRHALF